MFEGKKYVTKAISESIPQYLQNLLWYMVETMKVPLKDYLQIFELSGAITDGVAKQKIIHSQEDPDYREEHIISVNSTIESKIYIIDDGDHSTMLLAEEY